MTNGWRYVEGESGKRRAVRFDRVSSFPEKHARARGSWGSLSLVLQNCHWVESIRVDVVDSLRHHDPKVDYKMAHVAKHSDVDARSLSWRTRRARTYAEAKVRGLAIYPPRLAETN